MPRKAEKVVVGPGFLGAIKLSDVQVASTDDVVIAEDYTRNGRKENRVGREVSGKLVRR